MVTTLTTVYPCNLVFTGLDVNPGCAVGHCIKTVINTHFPHFMKCCGSSPALHPLLHSIHQSIISFLPWENLKWILAGPSISTVKRADHSIWYWHPFRAKQFRLAPYSSTWVAEEISRDGKSGAKLFSLKVKSYGPYYVVLRYIENSKGARSNHEFPKITREK